MIPMIDEIKTQGISFMNIPTNVMDNGVCWRTVKSEEGFKLQQNNITGHARIINNRKIRLAWGDMKAMQLAFNKLIKPWDNCVRGDVLAVQRINGMYSHYAIYIGNGKVIHYAAENSDFGSETSIHEGNFWDFLGNATSFDVLTFSENGDAPEHRRINLVPGNNIAIDSSYNNLLSEFDKYLRKIKGYHVYTPEETVMRAISRIGENKYNLAFNNCEHFALWCKTGIHESIQVEDMFKRIIFRSILMLEKSSKNTLAMTNVVNVN